MFVVGRHAYRSGGIALHAVAAAVVIGAALAAPSFGAIRRVAADAAPGGDGETWPSAFRRLNDALNHPLLATGDQIWIKGKDDGVGLYYYPDEAETYSIVPNDRASTFAFPGGNVVIQVLGGFAGTELDSEVDKRRPSRFRVVLSGDLLQNDGIAGKTMEEALAWRFDHLDYSSYADNAWNVVTTTGTNSQSVLDGCVVQAGHADVPGPRGNGAGIHCGNGTAQIRSCVIQYNRAKITSTPIDFFTFVDGTGGGVYASGDAAVVESELLLRDCRLISNHANQGGGLYMRPPTDPSPTDNISLVGCDFRLNRVFPAPVPGLAQPVTARGGGALLERYTGRINLANTHFFHNTADGTGEGEGAAGALLIGLPPDCPSGCASCDECIELSCACPAAPDPCAPPVPPSMDCECCPTNVVLTGCILSGNRGRLVAGGAIRCNRKTRMNFCTVAWNEQVECVGPIESRTAGLSIQHGSHVELNGCLFWDNHVSACSIPVLQEQIADLGGTFAASYCSIQGCGCTQAPHVGTFALNPFFLAPPGPGPDGLWATSDDDFGDLRLGSLSDCIDYDPALTDLLPGDDFDLDSDCPPSCAEDLPRDGRYRGRVKPGAASAGLVADIGALEHGCDADLNDDFLINGMDLAILLAAWTGSASYLPCPPPLLEDLNQDCDVNGVDLADLLAAWGTCQPPSGGGEAAAQGAGGPFEGGAEEAAGFIDMGCGADYQQFVQWLGASDWQAFQQWLECVTSGGSQ